MADSFDDFFGELEPQQVKRARIKDNLDCPIIFCDNNPNLNVLVCEYFSEKQLKYISSFFHSKGARVNIVYVFSVIFDEKRKLTSLARFFAENVRSDLKEWLEPKVPIVTIGRAIYATTFDTDIQVHGFYDGVFNNTFFYSPFVNNRIYPIDSIFKICAFGQPDQKTGEPIHYWDRWEKHFAENQIEKAIKAGDCSLSRKRSILCTNVDDPNKWLQEHTDNIPENEMWVAVDIETGGFNKLSDKIGDVTFSFDGWTAYHLDWNKINPRILNKFLQKHKCVLSNGKFDILFFMFHGCDLLPIAWDTMIAGHLLNEMRSNSLKTHAFHYTNYGGYDLELEKFKWKYPGLQNYLQIPDSIRVPYACWDAAITYQVWQAQSKAMKKEPELWKYYHKYCLPMLKIFIKAEYKGFCVDWEKVNEIGKMIQDKIKSALNDVRNAFKNPDLDPNKKQELGKFIESLRWPCINRNKAGGYKVSKKEFAEWEKMGYSEVKTLVEYSKWVIIWNTFIGADSNYGEDDDIGDLDEPDYSSEDFDSLAGDDFFSGVDKKTVHHDATGLWQYKGVDNRIHTTFHPFMTKSHRHRCVAKGTKVLINRGYDADKMGVPIEDVKVGDYAYCFDDNCNPVIRKVIWAGKTGRKEVIRLHYIGSRNFRGYLDVTPEHKIRLTDGTYVEAREFAEGVCLSSQKLKYHRKNRVLSMHRYDDRIFFTNRKEQREYRFVYEQLSGDKLKKGEIIHHKDGNHSNHEFANLGKMIFGDHGILHNKNRIFTIESRNKMSASILRAIEDGTRRILRGEECSQYKKLSKTACLRMLIKARGRPSYVSMDFETFKLKLKEHDIRWQDVALRYNSEGDYIPRFALYNDLQKIGFRKCQDKWKIGYYNLKKLCLMYGITYERAWANNTDKKNQIVNINNHAIVEVEYLNEIVDVYDIEVEEFHNFIANEICVHNSSGPNLQNLPKRNKEVSSIVRQCYIPPDTVPCKREDATQIWVFDRINGLTLNAPDDLVEIGLLERIKIPAKELINYDFNVYGYRSEHYRWAEPGEYLILETDSVNLQAMIAASMSRDKNLCNVFLSGGDFHNNNTYHILAKYQLFDECVVTFNNGQTVRGFEWNQIPVVDSSIGKLEEVCFGNVKKGDAIGGLTVTNVEKAGRNISYEEFCANAKKGKCKELRDIGKMIGLSFIFGASANNLAGGTLRMAWNPKMCAEFIKKRGLDDLQNQIIQSNKRLRGDELLYFVVASFFRSEFFKLYPELEKWIFECARDASNTGYRRSPWGSRRLLPQLRTKGKHADQGMYKNLANISVNSPVQDYETVVMSSAMIKIDSMYENLGYISYIVGTVHDSAITINHVSELESCLRISLEAFHFKEPATYGMPYSGECNVADYTKGEFWGFGRREVVHKDVKDVAIIRKRYPARG